MNFQTLPRDFYLQPTTEVAKQLLGHYLLRRIGDQICGGIIVETEAYLTGDPACHAYEKETPRNRSMWGDEGFSYVYRIYGIYYCFNAVCQPKGIAEAVLIRAIEPTFGSEVMREIRSVIKERDLTNGPSKLCAAMNISLELDGVDICDLASPLFIAQNPTRDETMRALTPLVTTTRIGITKAADWPLRFYLGGSKFVSKR